MNIVDALCKYNYNVSRGKVDGEILYTIDMPCDPCGRGTCEIWRTPVSVHRTYRTSNVSVVMSREGPVSRSQVISMFLKSNMHIFAQCSQWQKEQEELLGMVQSGKELRPYRLQPHLLSTLATPKAHHEIMWFTPKPDIDIHVETYLCMTLRGDEMKEETYGCETQEACHMDGYMVGYRAKELDASDIRDALIYTLTKHLGLPVVVVGRYAAYNIGLTDDYGDNDMWTLSPHNKMFTTDSLKQLLSTKQSRCWNAKVSSHNMYPDVPNMKVFDITARISCVTNSVQLILMLAHWTDCLQVWAEPWILPEQIVDSFDIGICKVVGVLLHDMQSLQLDTQGTGHSIILYYKPKPAHDWKITKNDVSMMDDYGMYKDPVKLNAFMNHAPLTFAVGACTRINHHLQNVTDQPDNDDLKHTCMLEAEHLYTHVSKYHHCTSRFCKSHQNTNRCDPKLLRFGVDRVKSMIKNTRLKPNNY